jgi:hypothetical protein
LALDVRALARRGYFAAKPGEVATGIEAWTCDGQEVGQVGLRYGGEMPHVITLEYRVRRPDEDWHTVREQVGLEQTPSNFGGMRRWFVCPGCGTRRAMFYCVSGIFRCRLCHDLAYRSTRESAGKCAQLHGSARRHSADG